MTTSNKQSFVSIVQRVITVLQTPAFIDQTFMLGGKPYKAKDLVTALQAAVDAIDAGTAAQINWKDAVGKQKTAKTQATELVAEIKDYIAVAYGKASTTYATFGFGPQHTQPTPATKVAAAAKNRATRKARGTLGKREKQNIKGEVASSTAPAVSASSSSPSGGNGTSH
jgi:hypothetical protein